MICGDGTVDFERLITGGAVETRKPIPRDRSTRTHIAPWRPVGYQPGIHFVHILIDNNIVCVDNQLRHFVRRAVVWTICIRDITRDGDGTCSLDDDPSINRYLTSSDSQVTG